jgi:hypothetical protein
MKYDTSASGAARTIFRPDAMRRRAEARNQPTLPRFTTPFANVCLWLLIGLLAIGAVAAASASVPVFASGAAVIVPGKQVDSTQPVVALAVLPATGSRPRPGDKVSLRISGERLQRSVASVEPGVVSPAEAQTRFGLSTEMAAVIEQPSVVAVVPIEPLPGTAPSSDYRGSVGQVEIRTGAQRLGSFLPIVGRFL